MFIKKFLEEKKAQMEYHSICKQMQNSNPDISKDRNGNNIINSKIGNLSYSFNELNQEHILKFNDEIIFQKEALYTDTVYSVMDINMLKNIKTHFKNNISSDVKSKKELVETFEKHSKRLSNLTFNDSNSSNLNGDILTIENNFDNINYKKTKHLVEDEPIDKTIIKLNGNIIYNAKETTSGIEVIQIKGSLLDEFSNQLNSRIKQSMSIEENFPENKKKSKGLKNR